MPTKEKIRALSKALDQFLADGFTVKDIADAAEKRDGLIKVMLEQKRKSVIDAVIEYFKIVMPNLDIEREPVVKEIEEQLKAFEAAIREFLE